MTILATAPTLEGISRSITAFYCGEQKNLTRISETEWEILQPSGKRIESTIVRLRGKRYRFETLS